MPKIKFKSTVNVFHFDKAAPQNRTLTPLSVKKDSVFEAVQGANGRFIFSNDGQLYEVAQELVSIIIQGRNWIHKIADFIHNLFN